MKKYLNSQKEKILEFARDEYKEKRISEKQLQEVYFKNFITNK